MTIETCANNVSKRCATVALDYEYRDHAPMPSFPGVGLVMPANLGYAAVAEVG